MDLYIIRHAWAGQYGDPQWPDDAQRPLTKKGRKRFAALVGILSRRGVEPSLIATSPMVRCRETAQILSEGLIDRAEVIERQELLPHGDLDSLLTWTAQQAEEHSQIASVRLLLFLLSSRRPARAGCMSNNFWTRLSKLVQC